MVLSAMTDEHVFVVSDRRMTNGLTRSIMSSTENKAIILNGEMVLAYTGLCNLDGIPTDVWVAELLAKEPVENWLIALMNHTGVAVRRTRLRPDLQRHAFLLTGYGKTPRGRRNYRPLGYLISNYHRTDGSTMRVPEQFSLSTFRLGNEKARVDSVGRDLPTPRRIALEREIRTQLRATPNRPERILDILGAEIRRVASKDSGVGSDLMAVSFPETAIHSPANGVIYPQDANWREELITFYSGADSPMVSYGPAIVQPGFQSLGVSISNDPQNHPVELHRLFKMRMPRSRQSGR